MGKTHQVGYALYIREDFWDRYKTYPEVYESIVLRKMNRQAHILWLESSTNPKFIIHTPGTSGVDYCDNMIGTVGGKEHLSHRWPSALGHVMMWLHDRLGR